MSPRLLPTRNAKVFAAVLFVLWLVTPLFLDEFWLSVLDYAGITAIAAIGLNLLSGFSGQISLGHAAFIGAGAYAAAYFGEELGLPLPLWLLACALVGGLLGAAVGPFALRLRGNYLAIVTLGLVFLADHVFRNWKDLTGGNAGRAVEPDASLGFVDFNDFSLGIDATRNQAWFWLIWALVALVALAGANIARSRQGRALQAVRDRDIAAELSGIDLTRTKVAAFALSSALAGLAGGLLGAFQAYVSPSEWSLFLSIQFLAVIIVGGLGSVYGPVIGALFVGALPRVIEEHSDSIPGVAAGGGDDGVITVFALNQVLFGLLVIGFLVLEPRGLAHLGQRVRMRFQRRSGTARQEERA